MKVSSRWWPLFWAFVILVLMAMPVPQAPKLEDFSLFDKSVHFALFGPLAFLSARFFASNNPYLSYTAIFLKATFAATAYGIIMEGMQALLPFRSAEFPDVLADALGSAAGAIAYVVWHKFRIRKKKM